MGGPNPESNPALATQIQKAKALGLPKDRIENAILSVWKSFSVLFLTLQGQGILSGATKEMILEAKGPGNVSMLILIATDNQNRWQTIPKF